MKKIRLLFLVWLVPTVVYSQRPELPDLPNTAATSDTTPAFIRTWRLVEDFTTTIDQPYDTLQHGFQIFNPVYRTGISNSYLGNLGLQSRNNLYFNDDPKPGFLFMRNYIPYLHTPENTMYMNITKPFTLLEYFTTPGGQKEEREEVFRAIHSQNINPFINAGFDLRLISSGGKYANQKAKVSNFTFFGSRTGRDYTVHSSLHYNGFNARENGGLAGDSIFRNSRRETIAYDVNLEEADSKLRGLNFQVTQRFRFGRMEEIADTTTEAGFRKQRSTTAKTASIIHTLNLERDHRLYIDEHPGAPAGYYPGYFIDPDATYDSTFYRKLGNTVQVMLDENPNRKNDFGARAFITHDWVRFVHNSADTSITGADTTVTVSREYTYSNVHLGASLLHTVGTGWSWVFSGRFYPLGYKAGDLVLKGEIARMFRGSKGESRIQISGNLSTEEPDHFLARYASNHFSWNNDFRKVKDIRGSLLVSNEAFSFSVKADISLVSGYVYFNEDALPAQHNPVISIMGVDVKKKFKLGPFHSEHQLNYFINTNRNVVRIPDLSYYTSDYFYFFLVKDVLSIEAGFDLYYYTRYRGLAFAPSSGMFYVQEEQPIGNYPYLNLFLTAKLKRTRFYVRWDHFYAGQIEKNYFHVMNYPTPGRVFRFGLSWTFYD